MSVYMSEGEREVCVSVCEKTAGKSVVERPERERERERIERESSIRETRERDRQRERETE